mgnify:CR=1 FL=1
MSLLRSADVKINVQAIPFLGSMHIVFHLLFNLPSSFFLLLCQILTHPDCTFATELTIILSIIRYGCRKKEGVESLRCEI